jgi:hypothetical protein
MSDSSDEEVHGSKTFPPPPPASPRNGIFARPCVRSGEKKIPRPPPPPILAAQHGQPWNQRHAGWRAMATESSNILEDCSTPAKF